MLRDRRYAEKVSPILDIERLIRYFELKSHGSWQDFDSAAKEVLTGLNNPYELADRLAAQGFMEFAWRDRSWQFAPTTLVEGRESETEAPRANGQMTTARWHLFGASARTATQLGVALDLTPSTTFIDMDMPSNAMRARFVRHSFAVENPKMLLSGNMTPEFIFRSELAKMFHALPNIKVAGSAFVGDSEEREEAQFIAAAQKEKFDDTSNSWQSRLFDESEGLWRIKDTRTPMYFLVFAAREYQLRANKRAFRAPTVTFSRVPHEIGRWFNAKNPGTAKINPHTDSITIALSKAVFDIPVVHERWLILWGCRRSLSDIGDRTMSFDRIEPAKARKLASLLSLREA